MMHRDRDFRPLPVWLGRLMALAATATLAGLIFQSVSDAGQSGRGVGPAPEIQDAREFATHNKGKKKKKTRGNFGGGGSFTSDPGPTLER